MLTATKVFQFDCAHMLSGHEGLCQNLHGHTYKLEVEAQATTSSDVILEGPSAGMVVDFSDLKKIVKECIVDKYDHAFIYNYSSKDMCETQLADTLKAYGKRVVDFPGRPTAENMCVEFLDVLSSTVRPLTFKITRIRVWETQSSYAEVFAQ